MKLLKNMNTNYRLLFKLLTLVSTLLVSTHVFSQELTINLSTSDSSQTIKLIKPIFPEALQNEFQILLIKMIAFNKVIDQLSTEESVKLTPSDLKVISLDSIKMWLAESARFKNDLIKYNYNIQLCNTIEKLNLVLSSNYLEFNSVIKTCKFSIEWGVDRADRVLSFLLHFQDKKNLDPFTEKNLKAITAFLSQNKDEIVNTMVLLNFIKLSNTTNNTFSNSNRYN